MANKGGGVGAGTTVEPRMPKAFALCQNYPNPFNPTTIISYALPKDEWVSLRVYDLLGRVVKILLNEPQGAGNYEVRFDALSIAGGVYFYCLDAGPFIETRKMLLLR
jgi:hypothetical protein